MIKDHCRMINQGEELMNTFNGKTVETDVVVIGAGGGLAAAAAAATMEWYRKGLPKMDQDDLKAMRQKGVSVYFLPPAERERWVKATAAYREKQLASFGEFGAKIRQIANETNKKYPYKPPQQ
jgi:hypothetical protein